MSARERYDAMIGERIGPELRALGFRRSRNRFGRLGENTWQVVDFQASQFGSRDGVRFTINLGVALRE
ncbi:MAG: hypothetical protein QOE28_3018 [Solirubrobacteraceae bacterium]|nr:hypothetical protein [Solirubrobacteraceae bacterium]